MCCAIGRVPRLAFVHHQPMTCSAYTVFKAYAVVSACDLCFQLAFHSGLFLLPSLQHCRAMYSDLLQELLSLVDELHACANVSIIVVSRINSTFDGPALYLPPLDVDSAVKLLRQRSNSQSDILQPEGAAKLVRLCGCNPLLLCVMGSMLASRRCKPDVSSVCLSCSCICQWWTVLLSFCHPAFLIEPHMPSSASRTCYKWPKLAAHSACCKAVGRAGRAVTAGLQGR
jgi:hypothetical protein